MGDPEAKDPNSAMSQALRAKYELIEKLTPKYLEAQELIQNDKWDKKYGKILTNNCLMKNLIESDAILKENDYDKFTLEEEVEQVQNFLFAAYDSTATSLSNLLYAIWKHPKEAEIVRNAIMKHPQLSNKDTIFSLEMLKACNELDCFVQETQRVYGIITLFIRYTIYYADKHKNILID